MKNIIYLIGILALASCNDDGCRQCITEKFSNGHKVESDTVVICYRVEDHEKNNTYSFENALGSKIEYVTKCEK